MSEDVFAPLDAELARMLAGLAPGARLRLARDVGRQLRASQAARVASQKNPDGSPFQPRKRQQALRDKQGSIRRKPKSGPMFRKLRMTRWLKSQATPDEATVGFVGAAARIARVHQLGLPDRVSRDPGAAEVLYPRRELLGLTPDEEQLIMAMALELIAAG
jgi:phage virion morphogenesis protein